MPLFQVLAATCHGEVYELDLEAVDAPNAVARADIEIRDQQPETMITHVHARHLAGETPSIEQTRTTARSGE